MNELQDTLEEIRKIFKCQEDMLDILENEQYRSLLAQKENQKLIETNRKVAGREREGSKHLQRSQDKGRLYQWCYGCLTNLCCDP